MEERKEASMSGWMNGWWIGRWMMEDDVWRMYGGWVLGWMDGWKEGRMDGWMIVGWGKRVG